MHEDSKKEDYNLLSKENYGRVKKVVIIGPIFLVLIGGVYSFFPKGTGVLTKNEPAGTSPASKSKSSFYEPPAEILDEVVAQITAPADGTWSNPVLIKNLNGNLNYTAAYRARVRDDQGEVISEVTNNDHIGLVGLPNGSTVEFAAVGSDPVIIRITK